MPTVLVIAATTGQCPRACVSMYGRSKLQFKQYGIYCLHTRNFTCMQATMKRVCPFWARFKNQRQVSVKMRAQF